MNPPNPPNPPNPNANPRVRQIRGPQSALTDFLASHNISANQIRQDANARRAAALAAEAAAGTTSASAETPDAPASPPEEPEDPPEPARKKETKAQSAKRKREEKAIAKIKASKKYQQRRAHIGSDSDSDEVALGMFDEMGPLPGQMENCEICEKRFSVTAYSRAGPDGGLLCPKCSRDLNRGEGAAKKKRKTAAGQARRKVQSNLLDGIYPGAKSLVTLCIETLARNVELAESLGDLPAPLVDKIAAILSKRRLMNSTTLDLFLQPGVDSVTVYDSAKLTSDDFIRIFQIVPTIKHLRLRNAIQFKNKVMDHLLGTTVTLETLSLHGSNLIDDERWNSYLTQKGSFLKALKVYYTDGHFGDEQIQLLAKTCPNLERLKICHNQKVTDVGISHIANLANLEHLSLEIYQPTTSKPYVEIINSIGPTLRTLSLATVNNIDDTVLQAIHDNCQKLVKLRITDNEVLTDAGFAKLFDNWYNPALHFVDFNKVRYIDAGEPFENPNNIGLCSEGFKALMSHSAKHLRYLNIHSCRHISKEAFEEVFGEGKVYNELREIDVSFCQKVDDFVVGSIFRCCPKLKTAKVFGCFGVGQVRVPKGKILIGVPNALGMQIEGMGEEDEGGKMI